MASLPRAAGFPATTTTGFGQDLLERRGECDGVADGGLGRRLNVQRLDDLCHDGGRSLAWRPASSARFASAIELGFQRPFDAAHVAVPAPVDFAPAPRAPRTTPDSGTCPRGRVEAQSELDLAWSRATTACTSCRASSPRPTLSDSQPPHRCLIHMTRAARPAFRATASDISGRDPSASSRCRLRYR